MGFVVQAGRSLAVLTLALLVWVAPCSAQPREDLDKVKVYKPADEEPPAAKSAPEKKASPQKPDEESPPAGDAPASQPSAEGETESLGDDDDDDDDDDDNWKPGGSSKGKGDGEGEAGAGAAPTGGGGDSSADYGASAQIRLNMDLAHEGAQPNGVSENVLELQGQLGVNLHYRPRRWMRLKVSGELLYRLTVSRSPNEQAFGHQNRNELEPRMQDSYIELSAPWLDVTAGMVTTVWGANTLVNPNDVLSARDLRDGPLVNPESMRVASPTVRAEAFVKDWTFSLVWMPGFTADQLDLFGSDYAFFGPGAPGKFAVLGDILGSMLNDSLEGKVQDELIQSELPRPFEGSVAAAKIALSAGGWDVAVQYAFNLTRSPVYRIQQTFYSTIAPYLTSGRQLTPAETKLLGQMLMMMDNSPIDATYRRYHQIGFSLTRAIWKLVLSVDLSYKHKVPVVMGGDQPFITDGPVWYTTAMDTQVFASTVGLRYSYGETVQVTLEGWYEVLIDVARLEAHTRPELLLGGPHRAGIALLATYKLTRFNLHFELGALTELANPGYVLAPKITYRVGDHLKVFLGAGIFGGSKGSTGGVLDMNDQVTVGVRGYL